MLQLVVEKGEADKPVYQLGEGEHLVGRSRSATIHLEADDVSSRHLVLRVKGGVVEVENLSRFGATVDDQPLLAPLRLRPGQRIQVGRKTILRLEALASAVVPDNEATSIPPLATPSVGDDLTKVHPQQVKLVKPLPVSVTASGVTMTPGPVSRVPPDVAVTAERVAVTAQAPATEPRAPAATATRAAAAPDAGAGRAITHVDFEHVTAAGTGGGSSGGGESDGTHAMKTRPAGVEEIEFLRLREQSKVRRRIYFVGGIVLLALALVVLLHPKTPNLVLEWDASYEDGLVSTPRGDISVKYPKSAGSKSESTPDGLRVLCPLGKQQNVMLRLVYKEEDNEKWVAMENATAIREWKRAVSGGEGQWTFDRDNAYFMGPDNGVQFWAIPYQRQQDGIWRGMATLIRHQHRLVVLRAEIPFSDQARAENFLYYTYLDLPQSFVMSQWAGHMPPPAGDVGDILRHCSLEVLRDAPATWAVVEGELIGAITKAVLEKKPAEEKDGLQLLLKLRTKMTTWYNAKKLMYLAARDQDDKAKISELARACQAVFQNPDDQRYYEVRKWGH